MWWWNKNHPLSVFMDERLREKGFRERQPGWSCKPDVIGDFRRMPFENSSFNMVLFDPPHIFQNTKETSELTRAYGSLDPDSALDDIGKGFSECWRVLRPGGSLVFKWAGELSSIEKLFPSEPIVGTRRSQDNPKWIIFYKPLDSSSSSS